MDEPRGISRKIHVEAGSVIPQGSWYGPVEKIKFHTEHDRIVCENDTSIKIITKFGMIEAQTSCRKPWYQYIHPARDIHEQNMTLIKSRDDRLYLQATKDIAAGEIITWWYDEALAWDLNIPYLTPANIIGIGRYSCVMCQKEFTYPNHLKLHIMYSCSGTKPVEDPVHQTDVKDGIMPHATDVTKSKYLRHGLHGNMPNDFKTEHRIKDDILSDCHAAYMQPYNSCNSHYTLKASFEFVPNVPTCAVLRERRPYQIDDHRGNAEAHVKNKNNSQKTIQIETDDDEPIDVLRQSCSVMSSNKGHLCVFCGKLYSRKYGLKIHLRTHTGYKPLKCKICLRAFGDPSNLNKHIRLHAQGSTPYQCTYCGKVLVRRRDLVRHLKSRHPNEVSQ